MRQYISVALNHPISGTWLQQPKDPQREEFNGQEKAEQLGLAKKSGVEPEWGAIPRGSGSLGTWGGIAPGGESKTRDGLREPILGGKKKEAIKGAGWK